jgi:hypothetical protein
MENNVFLIVFCLHWNKDLDPQFCPGW